MNTVTWGGIVLGLFLLILRIGLWWPGVKRIKGDLVGNLLSVVPLVYAWLYGVLAVLCVGGLVGAIADVALWGGNWLGDLALVWGVGGNAAVIASHGGSPSALTNGGTAMVLLFTALFVVMLNKSDSPRSHLWQMAWSGILLGLSSGFAGKAAVPLASFVNLAGAWLGTEVVA
jgi:hypothetical protein